MIYDYKDESEYDQVSIFDISLQVSIVPIGNPLFLGDVIVGDLSYPLFEIFDYLNQGKKICFVDDGKDRELDTTLLVPFNGEHKLACFI